MSDYRESIDEFEKKIGTTGTSKLINDIDRNVGKTAKVDSYVKEKGSVSTDSKLYLEPKKVIVNKYKLSK